MDKCCRDSYNTGMDTKTACSEQSCGEAAVTKGLCRKHYNIAYYRKTLDVRRYEHRSGGPCSVEGCESLAHCRGFCPSHYRRLYRHGDPLYLRVTKPVVSRRAYEAIRAQPEAINSVQDLARVLGVSRQRAHQLLSGDKTRARNLVADAIKAGIIAAPAFCFRCGREMKGLQAHHWDYDRPLDVGWFCQPCHAAVHPHVGGLRGTGEAAEMIRLVKEEVAS